MKVQMRMITAVSNTEIKGCKGIGCTCNACHVIVLHSDVARA